MCWDIESVVRSPIPNCFWEFRSLSPDMQACLLICKLVSACCTFDSTPCIAGRRPNIVFSCMHQTSTISFLLIDVWKKNPIWHRKYFSFSLLNNLVLKEIFSCWMFFEITWCNLYICRYIYCPFTRFHFFLSSHLLSFLFFFYFYLIYLSLNM